MFALTTLVYPVVLAALSVGAGLLVDRCSGGFLPAALLPTVGVAALIAVSQLFTYAAPLAPATPYAIGAFAVAGLVLGSARLRAIARRWRASIWQFFAPVLAYLLALAPVLLAGRPSFSSYMTLADSAVHMMGADFLLRHGQDYSHLDLHNSYGLYINNYYNTYYPSGADTLFGASAFLLGLPLIWAFQPFNAVMLASAACPAWLLMRRVGLDGGWAALAALSATIPALVYGYELIGSIKEITALAMILSLGALVILHRRWLWGRPWGAIPFALVAAAGVSALGAGFGAWILATAVILAVVLVGAIAAQPRRARRALALIGIGVLIALIAALPTWTELSGSLKIAQNISSTGNPGNLQKPLKAVQVFGVWVWGSYKNPPRGGDLTATGVLIALTALAAGLGAFRLIRKRDYALAAWIALVLLVWLLLSTYSTTWVDAKTLMLTTPVVAVLAWAGVAMVRESRLRLAAPVLALALAGGVLASDAFQYHTSNLAPTARYQELASIDSRFAGRGPTLFTDFDEYALYELRDLDIGGPNFIYGPPALAGAGGGYRYPVELDRLPPAALTAYPLIVTRRDPTANRPPSAYSLLWRGTYYEVWGRPHDAPAAVAVAGLSGSLGEQCAQIGHLAGLAGARGATLLAPREPELVHIDVQRTSHPAGWGRVREGLLMSSPGRLSAEFSVPHAGVWDVWLKGETMPAVRVEVDGRPVGSVRAQLDGNSLVLNTITPLPVPLSAGRHRLSLVREGFTLAPGNGGTAVLYAIYLAPANLPASQPLEAVAAARWRSLCGHSREWVEAVRPRASQHGLRA
ncbi:MAG: hypothetical protein ACLQMH_03530 [Solirubrobacteraceae bacterium]